MYLEVKPLGVAWIMIYGILINLINVLIKKIPESSLTPFSPCEDMEKKRLFMNQELGSHQTPNVQASWTSQLPEVENFGF